MATTSTEIDSSTLAEIAIRESLSGGDSRAAVTEAMHLLRAKLASFRKADRAAAAHLDAQLTGTLLAIAEQVRLHEPPGDWLARPAGYHLLAVFQAAHQAATTQSPGEGE